MRHLFSVLVPAISLMLAELAHSNDVRAGDDPAEVQQRKLDLTPPDLSAFALLGINPSQVTRPGTVRELSAAVLNGVRSDGTITPGVAIEWSPGTTWADTLQEYRESVGFRRITVSAATAADGTATRAAVGVRWVLVDESDPLANPTLEKELVEALTPLGTSSDRQKLAQRASFELSGNPRLRARLVALVPLFDLGASSAGPTPATECDAATGAAVAAESAAQSAPKGPNAANAKARDNAARAASEAQEDAALLCKLALEYSVLKLQVSEEDRSARALVERRVAEVKANMRRRMWNATSAQLGAGFVGRSDDSRWKTLEAERFRAFANFAIGAGTIAQVIVQADATKEFVAADDWALGLGARAVLGSPDVRGTAELYGQIPESGPKLVIFASGGELRLAANVWLEFQVGAQKGGEVEGPAGMITRANIKYGSE